MAYTVLQLQDYLLPPPPIFTFILNTLVNLKSILENVHKLSSTCTKRILAIFLPFGSL